MKQKWILFSFLLIASLQALGQKEEVFTIKNEKLTKKENTAEPSKSSVRNQSKPAVITNQGQAKSIKKETGSVVMATKTKKVPSTPYRVGEAEGDLVQYAYFDGEAIVTTYAPRIPGRRYKIQISDSSATSLSSDFIQSLSRFGRIDTEYLVDEKTERYLLGDYITSQDAERIVSHLTENGIKVQGIHSYLNGIRTL